jgi:hypothetical protein
VHHQGIIVARSLKSRPSYASRRSNGRIINNYRNLKLDNEMGLMDGVQSKLHFTVIPVLAAFLATIAAPSFGRMFYAGSVGAHAMTPEAWKAIVASADA